MQSPMPTICKGPVNRTIDELSISMLTLWPLIANDANTEDEQLRAFSCKEDRKMWPAKISVLTFQEAECKVQTHIII